MRENVKRGRCGGPASLPIRRHCHALALVVALLLPSALHASETCYREDELRADAQAKLADFIEPLVIACSEAAHTTFGGLWAEFLDRPEIANRLAEADALRASYYERLHGDEEEDWQLRWQKIEFAVISYTTEMLRAEPPPSAGCLKLRRQLLSFQTGGWQAYETLADRLLEKARPQVRLCPG